MRSRIDQAAQLARTAGDDRSIDLLRAEAHAAIVLQRDDGTGPAMVGHITITAPLSALRGVGRPAADAEAAAGGNGAAQAAARDEAVRRAAAGGATPAVDGTPITAAHLRELCAQLGALGVQAPPGGSLELAITDDDGRLLATLTPDQAARLAAKGCPEHGPDADCACPVVAAPPDTGSYQHTAAQERFIRTRDRTCRHPGCSQPAGRTDADHVTPHDCGGRTGCHNLCCLCRTHHRLKTFARGWRFAMQPDGTLTVTTPSGITRTTRPPGLEQRALPPPPVDDTPPPF